MLVCGRVVPRDMGPHARPNRLSVGSIAWAAGGQWAIALETAGCVCTPVWTSGRSICSSSMHVRPVGLGQAGQTQLI